MGVVQKASKTLTPCALSPRYLRCVAHPCEREAAGQEAHGFAVEGDHAQVRAWGATEDGGVDEGGVDDAKPLRS